MYTFKRTRSTFGRFVSGAEESGNECESEGKNWEEEGVRYGGKEEKK